MDVDLGAGAQEYYLLEVEHVKAHRSQKEKQEPSLFELFVNEELGG